MNITEQLRQLDGEWKVEEKKLKRQFEFTNFAKALAFVNKVGEAAEAMDHHPDIHLVEYNKVILELSSHDIGGLSGRDVRLAKAIEALL